MASKTISGIFGGKGTPAVGSWDALHSFSTRASDGFGGKVHAAGGWAGGQVSKALQDFYKTEKLNPCITSIKITVNPAAWTTAWEVTIDESPDGKAYVGFNSWGGASGGYPKKLPPSSHAYTNYQKELKNVLKMYPGADPRNVIDFYIPGGFRQIFFQYTIPKKFPNLPMSSGARKGSVGVNIGPSGSPSGLPEYNGISFATVTYTDAGPNPGGNPEKKEPDPKLLKKGSKGDDVKKVQEKLGLKADGDFGRGTEAAVKDWQTKNGLESNGIIDQKNWDKMFGSESKTTDGPKVDDWDENDPYTNNPVAEVINPLQVSGKFILKIKSGPGVMIGVTEVEIVNGVANFTGIQFDQKGDYIVTISSTSPDIEPIDITIKVTEEPSVIPQEEKKAEEEKVEGTRPIIAQIFPPKIELPAMVFDTGASNQQEVGLIATTVGSTPFINYNGMPINDRDIRSMVLYHDGLVPKIDITFKDSNNVLSKEPPRDDTSFELFMGPKSSVLKSIHLMFKIEDYKTLGDGLYQFFGTLDVSKLYRMKFKVYRGTSFEALKQICEELQLGFNSNIDNTKDEMPWRNIGDKQFKFMGDIIKHSYISEESFMAGYIDYYYSFNYVDIEKEMKRDISKDICLETGGVMNSPEEVKDDPSKLKPLALNSEKGMRESCLFFVKVAERNESTKTSIEQGYKTRTKFYDKLKKMFLVFDVDSTTSDGSKSHILKGKTSDKESFDNNYVTKYEGKIDTDNSHKNYNYAVTQNKINLDNMLKVQMDIKLPNPNWNIYKYQKVDVAVVKDAAHAGSPENVQWRWSGEWLILDIRYEFMNKSLYQLVTLGRKELGKDPEEMKETENPKKEEKPPVKEENPETPGDVRELRPNQVYKVGDEITVEDDLGERYLLKITKLSEDGDFVDGELGDLEYVEDSTVTNPESVAGVIPATSGTSGVAGSTSGTSGTSGIATTAGMAGSSGMSASTANAKYWPEVKLVQRQNTYSKGVDAYEMPQAVVTELTSNYSERVGQNVTSAEDNVKNFTSIFIAIKRPIPDFKPEKEEKNDTPHSWVLFELSDDGMTGTDVPSNDDLSKTYVKTKYGIISSRLFGSVEPYNDESGERDNFFRPMGKIEIIAPDGKVIIDNKGKVLAGSSIDPDNYTGSDDMTLRYEADGSKQWYERAFIGEKVDKDMLYTPVGKRNTIYIDLSNPEAFKPGNYTLKITYIVPRLKGPKRLIEPKDENNFSPYEEKLLEGTFTISKRSKRR
jgi:peptidoglycan hydrolase-like protein with peptidoglycan-binding domain